MNEKIPVLNNKLEAITFPENTEVMEVIMNLVGNREYELANRLETEEGDLYQLDIITKDAEGDTVKYSYSRAGKYGQNDFASETTIDEIFYMGDIPVSFGITLKYINGEWLEG